MDGDLLATAFQAHRILSWHKHLHTILYNQTWSAKPSKPPDWWALLFQHPRDQDKWVNGERSPGLP